MSNNKKKSALTWISGHGWSSCILHTPGHQLLWTHQPSGHKETSAFASCQCRTSNHFSPSHTKSGSYWSYWVSVIKPSTACKFFENQPAGLKFSWQRYPGNQFSYQSIHFFSLKFLDVFMMEETNRSCDSRCPSTHIARTKAFQQWCCARNTEGCSKCSIRLSRKNHWILPINSFINKQN